MTAGMSPGLLLRIEEADLGSHISILRNKLLANALLRLEIFEAYGTNISRMRSGYAGSGLSLEIHLTPNTFTAFLPNRNISAGDEGEMAMRSSSCSAT